jgi:hypothetical protein
MVEIISDYCRIGACKQSDLRVVFVITRCESLGKGD